MKKISIAFVSVLILGVLGACGGGNDDPATGDGPTPNLPYIYIAPEVAKDLMENSTSHTMVDVRSAEEYATERIEGAVLIPHNEIAQRAAAELPDKDAVIIVYCVSGIRASQAAQILVDQGYTQVYNMGGMSSWPYGTVSD
ncbi:MAG: rhodanese-like domain-containing protein [Propionibacteriaceae bacterium]|nr:rhodanese-like domain-containing protein [Propionibacteriaceae bacterium]